MHYEAKPRWHFRCTVVTLTCSEKNADRFLSSISIITPGKYCSIRAGAIPKLLAMLNNNSSELVANALKVENASMRWEKTVSRFV